MPVNKTFTCFAASRSRIAVRLRSISAGSSPRSPSLAPSSTMAASAPSPRTQSSRASPPADVSPDTAPSMMITSLAASFQRGRQLRLEPVIVRQPVSRGQRIAENQQAEPGRRAASEDIIVTIRQAATITSLRTASAPCLTTAPTPYAGVMDTISPFLVRQTPTRQTPARQTLAYQTLAHQMPAHRTLADPIRYPSARQPHSSG